MYVKNKYQKDMICSVCGEIITEIQADSRKVRLFTLVKKECPKCKKIRKFIVIEDKKTVQSILAIKIALNEELSIPESVVYKLLQQEDQKRKIK